MGNAPSLTTASPRGPRHADDLLSDRARDATSSIIRDLLQLVDRPGMLSLAGGLPAPDLLPVARVAAAADRVLAGYGPRALQYAPTEGMAALREILADRAGAGARGRLGSPEPIATPDDVLITTGSQQGLDLLARALCDPGDVVVVESPGYLGALQAFQASGARLVGVATDADGIRTDELEARLADLVREGAAPKVVYVVANFQNPSGASLALERRRRLLGLAEQFGFVVVEDDPYGELRFRGAALPGLRALATGGAGALDRVVSLGTVSKIVSPGLRVGWMIAPDWLQPALVRAKQAIDLHTSPLTQLIAADVLADGPFLTEHLDRTRSTYQERADALIGALAAELGDRIEIGAVDGGMFCWARVTGGVAATDLFPAAIGSGVAFVPGDAFCLDDSGRSHLRLCFTTLTPAELGLAASRLATALASIS